MEILKFFIFIIMVTAIFFLPQSEILFGIIILISIAVIFVYKNQKKMEEWLIQKFKKKNKAK